MNLSGRLFTRNRILTLLSLIFFCAFLANVQRFFGSYITRVVKLCAVYAICALSLNLVNGCTGLFSLGQAGFMAIGAYVTTVLFIPTSVKLRVFYLSPMPSWLANLQVPYLPAVLVGGLFAAVAAFLIGLPVLRLKGDYLAIATLGFSEIIRVAILNTPSFTNAAIGITRIPGNATVWLTYGIFAVVTIFLLILMKTSYGRAFKAIREDEVAAEAMGINLFKHKMISFVLSGFIAGISGSLIASVVGTIDPTQFRFTLTYNILMMVVIGGLGSISGSILGVFIVTIGLELLRFVDEPINFGLFRYPGISGMRMVIFSLILMVILLFWNQGIFGTGEFSWNALIRRLKAFCGLGPTVEEGLRHERP